MKKLLNKIVGRYRLLCDKEQSVLSSLYLALGWTICGEEFLTKRMLRQNTGVGCFVYTDWCLFWLFNEIQPLASESQLAPTAFKKKPRWSKTYK